LNALDELLDRHIVHEAALGEPRGYTFSHSLLQAAAYAEIDAEPLRLRHRRIGQVLESLYQNDLDSVASEVALHFDRAGEAERAANFYARAAAHGLASCANDTALILSERGLTLTTDDALRVRLLFIHEEAACRRGDLVSQRRDLSELRSSTFVADDDVATCELERRSYHFARAIGDDVAAARSLDLLERVADGSTKVALRAVAESVAGHSALHNADLTSAVQHLEHSRELFEQARDVNGQIECLALLAECDSMSAQEQSVAVFNRARLLADSQRDPFVLTRVWRAAAAVAWMRDGAAALEAVAERWRDLAGSIGDRSSEAWATFGLGIAARLRFDVAAARQRQHSAWRIFESLGDPVALSSVQVELAELETYVGRLAEAQRLIDLAAENCRRSHYQRGLVAVAITMAEIANSRREFDRARESAERALAMDVCQQPTRYRWLLLNELAQAELYLGRADAALIHAEENLAQARRFGPRPDVIADALCNAARAHAACGDMANAKSEADELVALLNANPSEQPRAQLHFWLAAQVYRSMGNRNESELADAAAFECYERLFTSLPDAGSREAFADLWFNREITHRR
jgi:tetratricopeptide (TPR) repeat protein